MVLLVLLLLLQGECSACPATFGTGQLPFERPGISVVPPVPDPTLGLKTLLHACSLGFDTCMRPWGSVCAVWHHRSVGPSTVQYSTVLVHVTVCAWLWADDLTPCVAAALTALQAYEHGDLQQPT
jgi:hypothetical protein